MSMSAEQIQQIMNLVNANGANSAITPASVVDTANNANAVIPVVNATVAATTAAMPDPVLNNTNTVIPVKIPVKTQKAQRTKADKRRISQLNFKLRSGELLTHNDAVFLAVGNSELADSLMPTLENGLGFDGLVGENDLSDAVAFKVLAAFMPTSN